MLWIPAAGEFSTKKGATMIKILAIPSAHRALMGLPRLGLAMKGPKAMGKGWGAQNRVMSQDYSSDGTYDDSTAYSTSSDDLTGSGSSLDPTVANILNQVGTTAVNVATSAAVTAANNALGLNTPTTNYPTAVPAKASTLPKWAIPAAIGGLLLFMVMGKK